MATRVGNPLRVVVRALPLAAACALSGCDSPPAEPPNIVLIAIDTLRHDHVSFNGYPRPVTPFLDALSRDARIFPTTYSQAPWTLPSFVSVFTSRYPSRHGVMWTSAWLADEEITLAELFREHGYATQGYHNNPLLSPQRNLAQGFEGYEEYEVLRPVGETWKEREPAPRVRRWLDERDDRPFFLFLHFMEPHINYLPAAALSNLFDPGYEGPAKESFPPPGMVHEWRAPESPGSLPPEALRTHGEALYDSEILEVDRSVGEILRMLRERDLLRNTVVVFLSDHGEELWDHGGFGHDHSVFDELVRVPFFLRFPSGIEPGIDSRPVELLDLAPTLLDAAGIPVPDRFEGRSLLRKEGDADEASFAEALRSGGEQKAYVEDDWKLVFDVFLGKQSLYDLGTDPRELHDLTAERPDKAAEMFAKLMARALLPKGSWHLAFNGSGDPDRPADLDARLTTAGRFLQCGGYDMENMRGVEKRLDKWRIEDDERTLTLQMTSRGDVDGVTFFVDPPESPVTLEVTIDGEPVVPEQVYLGAEGRHPGGSPFRLVPEELRSEAGVTPRGWRDANPAVAVWTVEGLIDLSGETVELDSATVGRLRALGYVE